MFRKLYQVMSDYNIMSAHVCVLQQDRKKTYNNSLQN